MNLSLSLLYFSLLVSSLKIFFCILSTFNLPPLLWLFLNLPSLLSSSFSLVQSIWHLKRSPFLLFSSPHFSYLFCLLYQKPPAPHFLCFQLQHILFSFLLGDTVTSTTSVKYEISVGDLKSCHCSWYFFLYLSLLFSWKKISCSFSSLILSTWRKEEEKKGKVLGNGEGRDFLCFVYLKREESTKN